MKKQKGYTIIELMIVIGGVAVISVIGGVLYVVGHFIAKFW